jgi:hypothetical protein
MVCVRHVLVVHHHQEILNHYAFQADLGGQPSSKLLRSRKNKNLVVSRRTWLSESTEFAALRHDNIAQLHQIFFNALENTVLHEYAALRLYDVRPLGESEAASAISQVRLATIVRK